MPSPLPLAVPHRTAWFSALWSKLFDSESDGFGELIHHLNIVASEICSFDTTVSADDCFAPQYSLSFKPNLLSHLSYPLSRCLETITRMLMHVYGISLRLFIQNDKKAVIMTKSGNVEKIRLVLNTSFSFTASF